MIHSKKKKNIIKNLMIYTTKNNVLGELFFLLKYCIISKGADSIDTTKNILLKILKLSLILDEEEGDLIKPKIIEIVYKEIKPDKIQLSNKLVEILGLSNILCII